jgi:signal transduction histidine kinase
MSNVVCGDVWSRSEPRKPFLSALLSMFYAARRNTGIALRYATAVVLPLALLLAVLGLAGQHANQFLFVPVLGVAATALLGGISPGLVSVVASVAISAIFLFEPVGLSHARDPFDTIRIAGLGFVSLIVAVAAGELRSAYRRAAEERSTALRLADQLAAEKARVERAVCVRDEVLAVVSHDLKNPLALINVTSELLDRRCVSRGVPELVKHIQTIRGATEQMERLIRDLLDVAGIEAGRLSIRPAPQSASGVAAEALEAIRPLVGPAAMDLRLEVPADLPEVQCDRGRIVQVLSNLLANATKATPAGGSITLSVSHAGEHVLFTVADTGRGIAGADLAHIFDRFRRGQSADYAGSGLGLAIAKGIVEAHGGRIWVESRAGEGARFFFTLPAPSARSSPTA